MTFALTIRNSFLSEGQTYLKLGLLH